MEDACYLWCLRQRVGLDDHLPGAVCQSAEAITGCPRGKRLDMWGRHATLRNAGKITRRHNRLRNRIANTAKSAALQVLTEQRTSTELLGASPGTHERAVHTADIHIINGCGGQTWVDTSVITCHHGADLLAQLDNCERRKLKEYGLRPSAQPTVVGRLVPCVVDAFGLMGNEAMALFTHLHQLSVAHLTCSLGLTGAAAERLTRTRLWHPASAILLRSAWFCNHLATHSSVLQRPIPGARVRGVSSDPSAGVRGPGWE